MHGDATERRRQELARRLMEEFVVATGVARAAGGPGGPPGAGPLPRRYLWTDAFAVSNLLGLHRATGEGVYFDRALALVDQVHHVLGRHRPDGPRRGWLSGLTEQEGELHPTCGGLRIGKVLPERRPDEPFDPELEWERDGQYFHYLTQWMHALHRVGRESGQESFHRWAIELAKTAHARFVVSAAGAPRRMVWKMSVALDRVLVSSMGQHDPLEDWLALVELEEGAASLGEAPALEREIVEAREMCSGADWATTDPLGAGALLVMVHRLAHLAVSRGATDAQIEARLLAASIESLEACARRDPAGAPVASRLAFRELGLAIGLHAVERLALRDDLPDRFETASAAILRHRGLALEIDTFWSAPASRRTAAWLAHSDINAVMLATSLAPEGYLGPD